MLAAGISPLDGRMWVRTLVPFVAGVFVEAGFQHEYPDRLPRQLDRYGASEPDKATSARLIDFQTLLAPVMAARWAVVHFRGADELITSDRAYALTTTPAGEHPSYAIPIDRQAVLVVTPQPCGRPLRWEEDRWVFEIEQFRVSSDEVQALNVAIAAHARQEIYGPSQHGLDDLAAHIGTASRLTAGLFASIDPASHLYDYFRVLTAINYDPRAAAERLNTVEWNRIDVRDWTAPIVVELLFPNRTAGGVSIEGNQLQIDLAYGIEFRRKRRATGDFRMGALQLIELEHLRIGNHRVETTDPEAVLQAADADARSAVDIDPSGGKAFELGENLRAQGDFDAAEIAYRWADQCGHPAAPVNLGNLRQLAGDPTEAAAAFRRAEARGNSNGTLNLGVLLLTANDFRGAEAAFRRAERQRNPIAGGYLGQLLEERGNLKAAELAYRRSDAHGNAAAAYALGQLLRRRGRDREAAAAFRRAHERGFAPTE